MSLVKREINIEGTGNFIEFIAEFNHQINKIIFALNINGIRQQTLVNDTLERILGYKYNLAGLLHENIQVVATVRCHFFMRPEYIIQVGDQVVHQQKGMWCGF